MLNALSSISTDYSVPSRTLLIMFGGISGGLGIPLFEFNNITAELPVKKIFLRDVHQAWYQGGLIGMGDSVDAVAACLKKEVESQNVDKVIVTGNSAGGYAALLFGFLLNADTAIVFSPQTFINKKERILHFDFRWHKQIRNIYKIAGANKEYFDLQKLFYTRLSKTRFHVHYSAKNRLDAYHACRLSMFRNFTFYPYEQGGHQLVKWLRDEHKLLDLLLGVINS